MLTNHLKEITYPSGGKVLIYGPGRAVDIKNHRSHHLLASTPSFPSDWEWAGSWRIFSSPAIRRATLGQVGGISPVFSSIIDVKKNDLPLYINWKWKSEMFDTLLKGV